MLTITFVLTLVFDMAVLYRNDLLSILILSIKKRYSSFLKKVSFFQKITFKVLKTFKIYIACHIKTLQCLKSRAICRVKTKTNPNFAVKLVQRSNYLFLLSILVNHIFQTSATLIRDNGMYSRSSQAAILVLN